MGPVSSLGKYIKHIAKREGLDPEVLKENRYREFILQLMSKLTEADYLQEQTARSAQNDEFPSTGSASRSWSGSWGDGQTVKPDVIKRRSYMDQTPKPNEFFRDLYSRDFARGKRLRAEDHTGQLGVDDRLDREDRFRAEWYVEGSNSELDEKKIHSESISALSAHLRWNLGSTSAA